MQNANSTPTLNSNNKLGQVSLNCVVLTIQLCLVHGYTWKAPPTYRSYSYIVKLTHSRLKQEFVTGIARAIAPIAPPPSSSTKMEYRRQSFLSLGKQVTHKIRTIQLQGGASCRESFTMRHPIILGDNNIRLLDNSQVQLNVYVCVCVLMNLLQASTV